MTDAIHYVTPSELMRRWRCSRPTVMRYLKAYRVTTIRLGRRPLIPESEILRIEQMMTKESSK